MASPPKSSDYAFSWKEDIDYRLCVQCSSPDKILSTQVVHLILDKLLWWILNHIMIGVNHKGDIVIIDMVVPNHISRKMWNVTTTTKRDVSEGIMKNWQST